MRVSIGSHSLQPQQPVYMCVVERMVLMRTRSCVVGALPFACNTLRGRCAFPL